MEHESFVARRAFAFGARQRVFLAGARMQEDREIGTDRTVARGRHRFGAFADHDPVAVARRKPEQGIADRTTDQIGVHRRFFFAGASAAAAGAGQRSGTGLKPALKSPFRRRLSGSTGCFSRQS